MSNTNIIWIIVDSVRTYRSGCDDRDRIDIMDEFGKDSTEFTNAFTSAPSSILAAASMFTGLPSIFISRHFNDWEFDKDHIDSLYHRLTEQNYNFFTILNSKEERRVLKNLVYPLSAKYYPDKVSHRNWWTNKEVTDVLEKVLNLEKHEKPGCYILWYDCRNDPTVSDEVKRALELFKKHGIYKDSIVIMNSDHGYPDPSSGLTKETMKKFSHDMIITDDNIKVPLFIKFPNGPKNRKCHDIVGTLDVSPTILDILGLPPINDKFESVGKSLLNMLNGGAGEKRIIRTDTRLRLADGRATSLRSDKYKYVYYWDSKVEELYDLVKDPYETKDISSSEIDEVKTFISESRELMSKMEEEVNALHIEELRKNFEENLSKIFKENVTNLNKKIILVSKYSPPMILNSFVESTKNSFPDYQIDILTDLSKFNDAESKAIPFDNFIDLSDAYSPKQLRESYDYLFYITENSKQISIDRDIIKIIKDINVVKSFMVDYNFQVYNKLFSTWLQPAVRFLKQNLHFYKEEPWLVLDDILFLLKAFFKILFKETKKDSMEADKVKRMRDRQLKAKLADNKS